MDLKQLSQLPSPFYRVSVKALIFDDQNRLLVGRGEETDDLWEMPGGGWEHDEDIKDCVERELDEELGIKAASIGPIEFIYRGRSIRGWMIVRVAVKVTLVDFNFKYGVMTESRFVDKNELMQLEFAADEDTIKDQVDLIWPPTA